MVIGEYQKKHDIAVLVETGTYMGDMVEAQKKRFKKIFSIELDIKLYNMAKERFKNDNNVILFQGDSSVVLPDVLLNISEPTIFWLDGHFSGGITARGKKDCPIFEELGSILEKNKTNHVILIDDAILFVGKGDYPAIEDLIRYVKSKNAMYNFEIKNDIIRFEISNNESIIETPQ